MKNEDDVADVMQDTILSAFEHMKDLKSVRYFKTWIIRILINQCNDLLRQRKRCVLVEWAEDVRTVTPENDRGFYELFFKTWIIRILINQCNDLLRQRKRCVLVEWAEDVRTVTPENDRGFYELLEELPENCRTIFLLYYGEGFHTKEIAQILEMNENTVKPENDRGFYELLEELPENCRTIFLLYYGEGFHTKEIAQILEMNENTVKSRLKRGRKKLEQVLCF